MDAWFDRVDTDHDGKMTLAEMEADAVRQFNVMDLRHDGKVTAAEVAAYRQKVMGGRYASISTPEAGVRPRARDDDSEGGEAPGERRRRDEESMPKPDASGVMPADRPDPVMSADTDLDGSVTLDEFRAYIHQNFADLDKSHSGSIDKDDLHHLCRGAD
jgi:Ca2+-binding EF-hand superfamily protein